MTKEETQEIKQIFTAIEQIIEKPEENEELLEATLLGIKEIATGIGKTLDSSLYRENLKVAMRSIAPILSAYLKFLRAGFGFIVEVNDFADADEDKVGNAFEQLKYTENGSMEHFVKSSSHFKELSEIISNKVDTD